MDEQTRLILIGWFLGIFGSLFIFYFQQLWKRGAIKRGIKLELIDSRARLMLIAEKVRMRSGTLDREFYEAEYDAVLKLKHDPIFQSIAELKKVSRNYSDEEIAQVNMIHTPTPDSGLAMKTFQIPFLDSKRGDLPLFAQKFQFQCMSILNDISLLNQSVDDSRYYFRISYTPSLPDVTYDRASEMMEETYTQVGKRAEKICSTITEIL